MILCFFTFLQHVLDAYFGYYLHALDMCYTQLMHAIHFRCCTSHACSILYLWGWKTGPEDIGSQVFVWNQASGHSLRTLWMQLTTLHRECSMKLMSSCPGPLVNLHWYFSMEVTHGLGRWECMQEIWYHLFLRAWCLGGHSLIHSKQYRPAAGSFEEECGWKFRDLRTVRPGWSQWDICSWRNHTQEEYFQVWYCNE